MERFLAFTITGLATAGIFGIGASGLVLTYTTTGIFNFAHGAIGMAAAFLYWQLRFDWGLPTPVALIAVIAISAPLFGVLLEVALMRQIKGANEATKVVVTVGLLAALIGLVNWILPPNEVSKVATSNLFQGEYFKIGDVVVTYHELTKVLVAVVVAIGLRLFLYRSRPGIGMRAAVDDRDLAALNGMRPDRTAMLAWAIGCALAAISGVFFVGSVSLDAVGISLLVVNVYAAALFGRLRSFPLTFAGAVFLGLIDAYCKGYASQWDWLTSEYLGGAFISAIPVVMLFLVLLALPQSRLRAHGSVRSLEFFPMPTISGTMFFIGCLIGTAALATGLLGTSDKLTAASMFATGIIALSFVPLVGFAGQVSLCQLSFAGIGAVTMAHLGTDGNLLGLGAAILIPACVGMLIALPCVRLSGIYLALATAAFAVALDRWIWALPEFGIFGQRFAIFGNGSLSVARVNLFGWRMQSEAQQVMLGAVIFSLVALLVVWIRRGTFGRSLLAMKDSETACATVGMNVRAMKLTVFAVSAGIAGLGGALLGGVSRTISTTDFQFARGLPIFMLVIVGGVGAVGGSFLAAALLGSFTVLPAIYVSMSTFLSNLFGVVPGTLGVTMGQNPNGVTQTLRPRFVALYRARSLLAAVIAAIVAMRFLLEWDLLPSVGDLTDGWIWVMASAALVFGAAFVAEYHAEGQLEVVLEDPESFDGTGLEWLGIDEPLDEEHLRKIDAYLALAEVTS